MASTDAAQEQPDRKLSDLFEEAFGLYNGFEQLDAPFSSPEFQLKVSECTALLETTTRLVSAAGLFADNETEDEIATEHLKYLLLPYFLGQLVQKKIAAGGEERNEIVRVAEVYFKCVCEWQVA